MTNYFLYIILAVQTFIGQPLRQDKSDSLSTIFIKEYSPKIQGQGLITFVYIINSNKIVYEDFKFIYKSSGITKIKMYTDTFNGFRKIDTDGNLIDNIKNCTFYSGDNFKKNNCKSSILYALISDRFLDLSNADKLDSIRKIDRRLNHR